MQILAWPDCHAGRSAAAQGPSCSPLLYSEDIDLVVFGDRSEDHIREMLGTKMRLLFQRKRGLDLFDLYWALTLAKPPADPAAVIEAHTSGADAGIGSW
jgi:hypothetical protein